MIGKTTVRPESGSSGDAVRGGPMRAAGASARHFRTRKHSRLTVLAQE